MQSTSGGLPVDEWPIFYGMFESIRPDGILVVGNSYGVSSVFSLAVNPDALVMAVDKFRTKGLLVTAEIASGLDGELVCVQGSTPEDLPSFAKKFQESGRSLDFVFFDAVHEPTILEQEYLAIRNSVSDGGLIVFHDCLTSGLVGAFNALSTLNESDSFQLLSRSTTGLGCIVKNGQGAKGSALAAFLEFYGEDARTVQELSSLLLATASESKLDFFDKVPTSLSFPPHPQI